MKKERIFWGLFFVLGAVAMVVGKLGFLGDVGLWSIFFTVFLAAALLKSIAHRSPSGILFSIAFLCIIYAKTLGITAITPWTVLGAAFLGSIGCSILFHPKRNDYWHHRHNEEDFEVETVEGDIIQVNTSLSGSIKYINSDDFKKAKVRCRAGAVKMYLDNAVMKDDHAVIEFDVSASGVELFVPKEWHVENRIDVTFGGVEEKNRSMSIGTQVLILTGEVKFSGITIIYV